eukprot:jgi/Tetstr1/447547/TSEL_034926.t1
MTELVRSWDDIRTEALYAGYARQSRTDADLGAALLVGTANTMVALMEGEELSRAADRLSSKDAEYDIPVDEAAMTVDMRVPYQLHLKHHVAAGPSGTRNEYFRCLVGKYAPASGHAAVRASMGRSQGGGAAVVDNMKEDNVSVLAPSQLGVGTSAANSLLIHGVRLIAEKLGARVPSSHCMHHMTGYWLCNCLPSDVEAFAEAMDATVFTVVERVLGVSFDPSITYGTDTNPVVTDFLAELLRDPNPTAAEAATLSENAVAMARNGLNLPITRLKGAGIRRMATVRDAAYFIGCMNDILPSYATAVREARGRLQAASPGHLSDAGSHEI